MKKLSSIIMAAAALVAVSCTEMPEVVEELHLSNVLMPTSTAATVSTSDGCTVTFSWTNSNTANQYVVEVYEFNTDSAPATVEAVEEAVSNMTPVTYTVDPSESGSRTSTAQVLERERTFYARVRGVNTTDDSVGESKWASFPYPIDTYTVMDALASVTVTERTSATVTVAWTLAEGDADGVNSIRVYPNPDDPTSAYKRVEVASGATSVVIEGLAASTRYTFTTFFNTASRGSVEAWTRPAIDGTPTTVNSTAALKQALADGARTIVVEYSETPYEIYETAADGTVTPSPIGVSTNTDIAVYGNGTATGDMPTIIGYFDLPNGLTSLHLEGLTFNGQKYAFDRVINLGTGFATPTVSEISMLNCNVTGYRCGVYYDNTSAGTTIDNLSFSNIYVTDNQGEGGDGFDMRTVVNINNFTIKESTFTSDMRVVIRMDKAVVGNINVSNNTFNSVAAACSQGTNKGIFYVQATGVNNFVVNNNLFLNIYGDSDPTRNRLFRSASGNVMPTAFTGNYVYNVGSDFWAGSSETQNAALAGFQSASVTLGTDPCVDSPRNILNVTNADVISRNVGDPRWFAEYVVPPTPELVPVEYGYVWDLTDQMTFYETVEESTVRGNTQFILGADPINVTSSGFEFTGAGTYSNTGVPTSSAIAFLVDGPGSIFASTLVSGSNYGGNVVVAVGPADGGSATVVGSLYAGATDAKVVFEDIATESLIYLCSGSAVVLSSLEWSDDVATGSTSVADPVVTATPGDGTLKLEWPAVEGAGSYTISFGEKGPRDEYGESEYLLSTNENSYTFEAFPSGTYYVNVQAISAEPTRNDNSNIVSTQVTVTVPKTMPQLTNASLTQDDFEFLVTVCGTANQPTGVYYKGFLFTSTGNAKFNSNSNYGAYMFNTGGSSNVTADAATRTIRFVAGGAGKLTYVTTSNAGSDRTHAIAINHTLGDMVWSKAQPSAAPASWDDWTIETELSTVAGDVVDLAGAAFTLEDGTKTNGNVNFLSLTWEPAGALGPDAAGLTPVSKTTTWGPGEYLAFYAERSDQNVGYGADFTVANDYYVFNNFMIYAGATFRVAAEGAYLQMSGASFVSSSGETIATYSQRFLRFRVAGSGTLTVEGRATNSSGQSGRQIHVAVGSGEPTATGMGTIQADVWNAGAETSFANPHSWNITASNGDYVTILVDNALRIGQVTWTPAN